MFGRYFGVVLVIGLVLAVFIIPSRRARSQESRPGEQSAVARLAEQRLELATRGYNAAVHAVRNGRAAPTATAEWARRRAKAALDLPNTVQRLAVLQDSVRVLKDQVSLIDRGVRAGVASEEELMLAQDRELECELWLAKVREPE